jgi:acyl-CoA reductase-like NAD-dependent aldehyde dehydrogenase
MNKPSSQTKDAVPAPDASRDQLDRALEALQAGKQTWAELPVAERIRILDQIHDDLGFVEDRWVAAGMQAKGTRLQSTGESEEWFTLTVTYRLLRYLRKSLKDIEPGGLPRLSGKLCWKNAGRWEVDVFPQNWQDKLALPFIRAEAWLWDSYKGDAPPMASFYKQKSPDGKVVLVLAAGNIASQVTYDLLQKLFVEGHVVLLKMNPVNAYLSPLIEEAFRAVVEPGFMQVVRGGAEVGTFLSQHPKVDEIHLTGSDRTYEAIVFGPGPEGQKRKEEKKPILTKPFTAELGNVSPVIIVPGPWSQRDIRAQAMKIGSWQAPNAGFNCLTPRVLIQSKTWDKREQLNEAIASYLAGIQTRKAYYPGAADLYSKFVAQHPEAQQLGAPKEGELPWTFVPDLEADKEDEICFRREAFMSFFSETAIDAKDTVEFIEKAVEFANQQLWGSLCASIIVHPKSLRDPLVAAAVDQAIVDLNYGSVVINHWGALAYYLTVTPWGAPPGHDLYDIQSGTGKVNNPLMFDQPIKSVVHAPFISIPDPYMAHSKTSYRYFRQDTRYQSDPSIWNLAKLLWYAALS